METPIEPGGFDEIAERIRNIRSRIEKSQTTLDHMSQKQQEHSRLIEDIQQEPDVKPQRNYRR